MLDGKLEKCRCQAIIGVVLGAQHRSIADLKSPCHSIASRRRTWHTTSPGHAERDRRQDGGRSESGNNLGPYRRRRRSSAPVHPRVAPGLVPRAIAPTFVRWTKIASPRAALYWPRQRYGFDAGVSALCAKFYQGFPGKASQPSWRQLLPVAVRLWVTPPPRFGRDADARMPRERDVWPVSRQGKGGHVNPNPKREPRSGALVGGGFAHGGYASAPELASASSVRR